MGFQQDQEQVFLILEQGLEAERSYLFYQLDLVEFKVTKLADLPLTPGHDYFFFTQSASAEAFLIRENSPETQQQRLLTLNLSSPNQVSAYQLDVDMDEALDPRSFFSYEGRNYIFDANIDQLYEIKLDDAQKAVVLDKTNLRLGGTESTFLVHYGQGDRRYLFRPSPEPTLIELDVSALEVVKTVSLARVSGVEDMGMYAFYIYPELDE